MTVLKTFIVEDSPVIRDNLAATLEELSPVKVVGSAPDEDGAFAWLDQNEPTVDLIIIDIFLRSGSGLGVLQRAAEQKWKGRRVVLTNYASAEIRKRCLALGADRVFDKSTQLDELIDYCSALSVSAGNSGEASRA